MLHYPELMDAFNERVRGRIQPAKLILSPENFQDYCNKVDGFRLADGRLTFNGSVVVIDPNEPNFRFEGEMVY